MTSFILFKTLINQKKLLTGLLTISGLNKSHILKIINFLGLKMNTELTQLTSTQIQQIKFLIESKESLFYLKNKQQKMKLKIQNLITMRCYKGLRHQSNLPVNGQRTHSNAKTNKKIFRVSKQIVVPKKINSPLKKQLNLKSKK